MTNEALLIVDMLNDFVRGGAPLEVPSTRQAIPAIQRELASARRQGTPVIYICDAHAPDDREFSKFDWPAHAVKGTAGAQVVDELKPREGDIIIEKTSYAGFYGTRLEETLHRLGVKSLILTGTVTHICIMFIAFEAALRGFDIIVPEDAVAGLAQEDHEAALRIMRNVLGVRVVHPSSSL